MSTKSWAEALRIDVTEDHRGLHAPQVTPYAERNDLAAFGERPVGRLEHPDHAQPGLAVVERRRAARDAVEEVGEFRLQRLGLVHLRRPDVARAVAHEQVVDALLAGDGDALVVDLDLLVGLEVVPHQHLVAAADQRRPHLHRREPVHVDVREDVVREVDGEERHVGVAVEVAAARRDHRLRLVADDVVHDGEVVRRQVPHDADVVLEEAEVDARRVEVVERAEGALVDEFADLLHRPREEERVVHHDPQVLPGRQLDELLGLLRGGRERLLDEHVLAVLEGRARQLVVRPDGRDDGHRVDVGAR